VTEAAMEGPGKQTQERACIALASTPAAVAACLLLASRSLVACATFAAWKPFLQASRALAARGPAIRTPERPARQSGAALVVFLEGPPPSETSAHAAAAGKAGMARNDDVRGRAPGSSEAAPVRPAGEIRAAQVPASAARGHRGLAEPLSTLQGVKIADRDLQPMWLVAEQVPILVQQMQSSRASGRCGLVAGLVMEPPLPSPSTDMQEPAAGEGECAATWPG